MLSVFLALVLMFEFHLHSTLLDKWESIDSVFEYGKISRKKGYIDYYRLAHGNSQQIEIYLKSTLHEGERDRDGKSESKNINPPHAIRTHHTLNL